MKPTNKILMLLAALVLTAFSVAQADNLQLVSAPPANAWTVNWSQLNAGVAGTSIAQTFVATGNDPHFDVVTGQFAAPPPDSGTLAVQGTNWGGNFHTGDYLVWAGRLESGSPVGAGPLDLDFLHGGYIFVGAYFQQDVHEPFTAELQFFNGSTSLGFVTESGISNDVPGSAMFIGGFDKTGANITRVVFSETAGNLTTDFAIDTLYYGAVPEPGTMVLLGSGLLGLASFARRRISI